MEKQVIDGKIVKRWFTRGKARIPIFEDGTIGKNQNQEKQKVSKNEFALVIYWDENWEQKEKLFTGSPADIKRKIEKADLSIYKVDQVSAGMKDDEFINKLGEKPGMFSINYNMDARMAKDEIFGFKL